MLTAVNYQDQKPITYHHYELDTSLLVLRKYPTNLKDLFDNLTDPARKSLDSIAVELNAGLSSIKKRQINLDTGSISTVTRKGSPNRVRVKKDLTLIEKAYASTATQYVNVTNSIRYVNTYGAAPKDGVLLSDTLPGSKVYFRPDRNGGYNLGVLQAVIDLGLANNPDQASVYIKQRLGNIQRPARSVVPLPIKQESQSLPNSFDRSIAQIAMEVDEIERDLLNDDSSKDPPPPYISPE